MKTLVTDDFAERQPPIPVTFTHSDGTTTTHNATAVYFAPLPEDRGPINVGQAYVGKPVEEIGS